MAIKSENLHKAVYRKYTSRPSDRHPDEEYSLPKFGHAQKAKFLSSPLLLLFLSRFFFCCWAFTL